MTPLRILRSRHAHALYMNRLYPGQGWNKAVKRLCDEIMQRSRPARGRSQLLLPKTAKAPYERAAKATQ